MVLVAVFISAPLFIIQLMLSVGGTLTAVFPDGITFWVGFVFALPLMLLLLITAITLPLQLSETSGNKLNLTSRGLLHWPDPNVLYLFAVLLFVILIGLLFGWVLQMVWRSKWWVKIIVALPYIVVAVVSGLLWDFLNTKDCISNYDHQNYCKTESCEEFVADAVGIRQVRHQYLKGSSYLLSYTDNGGQDWRMIVSSSEMFGLPADCSQTGGLDARFFWTGLGDGFIFTHDGGNS